MNRITKSRDQSAAYRYTSRPHHHPQCAHLYTQFNYHTYRGVLERLTRERNMCVTRTRDGSGPTHVRAVTCAPIWLLPPQEQDLWPCSRRIDPVKLEELGERRLEVGRGRRGTLLRVRDRAEIRRRRHPQYQSDCCPSWLCAPHMSIRREAVRMEMRRTGCRRSDNPWRS